MHAKGEIDAVLRVAAVDMPPAFNDGLKQGLRSGRVDRQMLMAIHCQQAGVGKLIFNAGRGDIHAQCPGAVLGDLVAAAVHAPFAQVFR
ncbi:Uncharacterised protein [Klebsiella pneumoniae]|nr:Uncharacterised protein [Klebsiella pneumoniae]